MGWILLCLILRLFRKNGILFSTDKRNGHERLYILSPCEEGVYKLAYDDHCHQGYHRTCDQVYSSVSKLPSGSSLSSGLDMKKSLGFGMIRTYVKKDIISCYEFGIQPSPSSRCVNLYCRILQRVLFPLILIHRLSISFGSERTKSLDSQWVRVELIY